MKALDVELTARVLSKFNITFTSEGVRSLVQKGLLKTVPRHNSNLIRGSRYGYAIDLEPLVAMLRNRGVSDDVNAGIHLTHWRRNKIDPPVCLVSNKFRFLLCL